MTTISYRVRVVEHDDYGWDLECDARDMESRGYVEDAANHREWAAQIDSGDLSAYVVTVERVETCDACACERVTAADSVGGCMVSTYGAAGVYGAPAECPDPYLGELAADILAGMTRGTAGGAA